MGKGERGEGVASVIGTRASTQFSMPSARASVVLLRTRHWLKMRRKGDAAAAAAASVMSDSVQPHRRQPTRLLRPWDSPGKITGVGCHFLL